MRGDQGTAQALPGLSLGCMAKHARSPCLALVFLRLTIAVQDEESQAVAGTPADLSILTKISRDFLRSGVIHTSNYLNARFHLFSQDPLNRV